MLLFDILALLANDNSKLTLIVSLVVLCNRRNDYRFEGVLEGRRRLHKEDGVLGDRHLGLLGMLGIVESDTTKDRDVRKRGEQFGNRDDGLGDGGGRG
jgi:hypothetical protein